MEYGGGLHAEVRFYFRYTWQLCLASGSLGHLGITLSLVKKNLGGLEKIQGHFIGILVALCEV